MRTLLEAIMAVRTPGVDVDAGCYRFAPVGPRLTLKGDLDVVLVRRQPDRAVLPYLCTTAGEASTHGFGLRTFVLIRVDEGVATVDAVVDGWTLVRTNGHATDLSGADLRGADLRGADLTECDLTGANLEGACLEQADLRGADLHEARLQGANLRCASLWSADLTYADLRRTDLRHSDLRQARCHGAAFRGADVWAAYVWDVDVSGAFLEGCQFERADHRGMSAPHVAAVS